MEESGKTWSIIKRNDRERSWRPRKEGQEVVRKINQSYYVVSESLPLLLFEGLTEDLDEFVQLLAVAAQELPDVLQALQAVGGRRARLSLAGVHLALAGVHLHWSGDAQDAVALLLVVVEGFLKQDGDGRRSGEAGSQQDLPVLDPNILQQDHQTLMSCLSTEQTVSGVWLSSKP